MRIALVAALVALTVVAPAAAKLGSAFKIAAGPAGTLLVADAASGRIVRLTPATRATAVFASGLTRLAAVCSGGGRTYAIADEKLWRVGGGPPTLVWTSTDEGPTDCAVAPDGTLYVSRYGDHVDRIDGAEAITVASGLDRPHGLEAARDGSVYVADSYAGAVRRIAPDGTTTTVASRLGRPMDVAVAADGSLRVVDLQGRRLLRIRGGRPAVVAKNLGDVVGVTIVRGVTYVAAAAGPFRVARIAENGLVTRLA